MHHLLSGRDPQLEPPFSFPPLRSLAPEVSIKTADAIMRALEQDLTKRPASAKEMLRALPVPPPRPSGKLGSGNFASPSPLSTMPTGSFGHSVPDPTPAKAPPPTPWRSSSSSAPASTMPTIVLSEPIAERIKTAEKIKSGDSAAGTAAKMVGPQIKKAIELGGKARDLIERRLKSRLASMTAAPSVSSTAKTKDLKPLAGNASYGAHPGAGSTVESSPTNTGPRAASSAKSSRSYASARDSNSDRLYTETNSNGTDPAKAPAKLVARGDETEFGIFGMRTLIGRSHDVTDQLDIDLKPLAHGGERVSRRHAEIIKRGADYFIRDLGSLNGTYIAGRGKLGRDQLYKLKDRDQVVLGGAILQFRKR
jgi:hypothetical protein